MELLGLLSTITPDVILLDVQTPCGGMEVLKRVRKLFPKQRIVATVELKNNYDTALEAMVLEANSCVSKDLASIEPVYEAICGVKKRDFFTTDLINNALGNEFKERKNGKAEIPLPAIVHKPLVRLNEKETAILRMMCEELDTDEIAKALDLSPRTIGALRDKIRTKTGAKNSAGLVMYAIKSGLAS